MDYSTARDKIQDGDIIMVSHSESLFNHITKVFTGKYVHCGIAIWLDGGLWMAEINNGRNHVVPVSQLVAKGFTVYSYPVELDRTLVRTAILESVRISKPYGYLAAIIIGINEFFSINMFIHWKKIITCGGYVSAILDECGRVGYSYTVSPSKLSESLNFMFEVTND